MRRVWLNLQDFSSDLTVCSLWLEKWQKKSRYIVTEKLTSTSSSSPEVAGAPADGGDEEQDGGGAGEGRERQLRRAGPFPHQLQGPSPQVPASGQSADQ